MNASIAELLKLRIQQFSYVEKLGGLVRAITLQRQGQNITIPIGSGVEDPLECGDEQLLDLVPDERYRCIVFFEDRGLVPVTSRTRGQSWTSNLRLVCWVNTSLLGGDVNAGDAIMQQFLGAIQSGPYNIDPFVGVRHKLSGVATKGPSLFSTYTFPEGVRQYLLYPFDAFAIDIATDFRIRPGCEPTVSGTDVACWTPPSTYRRRHPREFTCEELTDPTNGLTDAQLEDCLNCSGTGPTVCPIAVTVNGSEITEVADACETPALALTVKDQDGNPLDVTFDGLSIVVDMPAPSILPYANKAAAVADTSTVPTTAQVIHVVSTRRFYPCNGTSTVSEIVTGENYLLPVREEAETLYTEVEGTEVKIQINT